MSDPTDARVGVARDDADAAPFLLPTGTVTFLLTDVEGSTAAWEAAPEAMAKAISRHYEILADAVGRHRGVRPVEQGEGDSIVAAFSRGIDAVAAAVDAQRELADEPWPDGADLRVRMALHTGDAQLRDAFNYFGATVIRAARLRALAHGGQILGSRATHDLVADQLPAGASWVDLGAHRLRDLGRPEHVFQLRHPSLPDDFPPLRGLDASPNNLPAQLSTFVGRERELATVQALLDEHRLVTLTGSGGCGKTRLALQVAADRTDRHPDGCWFVELASLEPGAPVGGQLADVLAVPEDPSAPTVEVLAAAIADRSVLLVVDNCEHVIDEVAELVDRLASRCPYLTVLATSRQVLEVPGEVVWRVPSMTLPQAEDDAPLDALRTTDAVALFCERARRGRPDFALAPDNARTVASICRRLDGIPLAIELAAARVRAMGLDAILDGLDDRFHLLTGGGRTLVPRQQTLLASVDWSFRMLSDDDRTAFCRLSAFSAPFTLDAAAAVADRPDVLDDVLSLVDRSLLQVDEHDAETRYRYLETIKTFGRARLRESGEHDATRDRHLAHHLALAQAAGDGIVGPDQSRWLTRLDRSYDDLRAALEWASESYAVDDLLRLTAALGSYWHARGHAREAQLWCDRALTEAPDAADELRAAAMTASAYVAFYSDDLELARSRAEHALELGRVCGDARSTARALDTLASLDQFADPAGVQTRLLEAAALAEASGDRWTHTDALQKAAYSDFYRDRWPEAYALAEQSGALAEELDNPFFLSWHETLMGQGAFRQGRFDEGRVWLRAAYAHAVEVGEPMTIASAAMILAGLELNAGAVGAAGEVLDELVAVLGDRAADGFAGLEIAYGRGLLALASGDPSALATLEPLVEGMLAQGLLFPTWQWMYSLGLGQVAAGDDDRAQEGAARLHEMAGALQSDAATAAADLLEALVHHSLDRPDKAAGPAARALVGFHGTGLRPDVADALELVASCLAATGGVDHAARLYGAVDAIRDAERWVGQVPVLCPELVRRDRARLADLLDPDVLEARQAEGRGLSMDDAVALATRARGTRDRPATGWASLTPTELAVVRLVAEGRTNPEIASALFVSRSTVKTHVSHALAKLGLSSRAELAAATAREDT